MKIISQSGKYLDYPPFPQTYWIKGNFLNMASLVEISASANSLFFLGWWLIEWKKRGRTHRYLWIDSQCYAVLFSLQFQIMPAYRETSMSSRYQWLLIPHIWIHQIIIVKPGKGCRLIVFSWRTSHEFSAVYFKKINVQNEAEMVSWLLLSYYSLSLKRQRREV